MLGLCFYVQVKVGVKLVYLIDELEVVRVNP